MVNFVLVSYQLNVILPKNVSKEENLQAKSQGRRHGFLSEGDEAL